MDESEYVEADDDKTELIVFASKYKHNLYNDLSITIGDTVVDCSSQVKDRGSSLIECYHYVSMCLIPQKRADFTLETLAE